MQTAKTIRRGKRAKVQETIILWRRTPKGKLKKVMAEETISGEVYDQNSLGRRLLMEGVQEKKKRFIVLPEPKPTITVVHTAKEGPRPTKEEREYRKQARAVAREEMFERHRRKDAATGS